MMTVMLNLVVVIVMVTMMILTQTVIVANITNNLFDILLLLSPFLLHLVSLRKKKTTEAMATFVLLLSSY